MARIECTAGGVSTAVAGVTYSFERDSKGRFVANVYQDRHIECLLGNEHYRLLPDVDVEDEAVIEPPPPPPPPADPATEAPVVDPAAAPAADAPEIPVVDPAAQTDATDTTDETTETVTDPALSTDDVPAVPTRARRKR